MINSDTGKLTLDTQSLSFADIAGLDKEHSYYLNVGGSYGLGGGGAGVQDSSQTGKGAPGANSWSVHGYNASKDREQQVRATVGAGTIVVRDDAATGNDSTAGLNRDPSKGYEVTRDSEHRTDLYATSWSVQGVLNPIKTADGWKDSVENYGEAQKQLVSEAAKQVLNEYKSLTLTADQVPANARSQLGSDEALKIAKALVAGGISADILTNIKPDGLDALQRMVMLGEDIVRCNSGCATDASGGIQTTTGVMAHVNDDSVTTLPATEVIASATPTAVEAFLSEVVTLSQNVDKESLAAAMLAAQVAMGLARFVFSQAIQAALATTGIGERVDEAKRDVAIDVVSKLTQQTVENVRLDDAEARKAYTDGTAVGIGQLLDGSESVVGAKFIVDSLLQATVGAVGKAAGRVVSVSEPGGGVGAKAIPSIIEPKIAQQMGKRGWTTNSLDTVIANPSKTVVTKDTRFDPVSGMRLNDPATGYIAKDGSYVVRNDRTGAIVQVSDKNDKNWVAPWD